MSAIDVTVVLPIYNEVENIEPLLLEIEEALSTRTFEVIAVDDGSKDGSRKLLSDLAARKTYLKTIFFRANSGQSAAFDAGFRHASGRIVITMDADRQNDPRDIPKMINLIDEGHDFVTGWRRKRRDGFFLRTLPSRIANFIIRKVTGTKLHDMGCSLKAYRREITDEMRLYGEMHRFISVLAEGLGARVTELEVNHRPRVAGQSKYGLARTFKVVLDLFTIWFMKGYQTKPIYVFGGVGLSMLALSFAISVFVLYEKFAQGAWVHRNPLFIMAVTISIMGVQLLALGLLSEMLVRTYFESQGKPAYSILSKNGFPK